MKTPFQLVIILPMLIFSLVACKEPNAAAVVPDPIATGAAAITPPAETGVIAAMPVDAGQRKATTLCNVELVDGKPFDSGVAVANKNTIIRGWLGDDSGMLPATPMLVAQPQSADLAVSIPLDLKIRRNDVVDAFPGKDGLGSSGFESSLGPASLAPGQYHLYLTYSIGAEGRLCDNGRQIMIPAD